MRTVVSSAACGAPHRQDENAGEIAGGLIDDSEARNETPSASERRNLIRLRPGMIGVVWPTLRLFHARGVFSDAGPTLRLLVRAH